MAQVEEHVNQYNVDIMKNQRAKSIRKNDLIEVELENGAVLKAKSAILSVGAAWRNVNVPGEEEFRTKGVTNCPHCDGPLFEGKEVPPVLLSGHHEEIEKGRRKQRLLRTIQRRPDLLMKAELTDKDLKLLSMDPKKWEEK